MTAGFQIWQTPPYRVAPSAEQGDQHCAAVAWRGQCEQHTGLGMQVQDPTELTLARAGRCCTGKMQGQEREQRPHGLA